MAIETLYDCFKHWSNCGTVWVYSDPHFDDKELARGIPARPNAEAQVKAINSKVGRKDTLIILGDIGNIEYVKQLRGYKILIAGNHDSGLSNYKRIIQTKYFKRTDFPTKAELVNHLKNLHPNCKYEISEYSDFIPAWCVKIDNQLFDEVYGGPLIISEKLILSHEPILFSHLFNIHGHVHQRLFKQVSSEHLNVCSDVIDYTPINLNQLIKNGLLSKVDTLHRKTINNATKRKRKRNK